MPQTPHTNTLLEALTDSFIQGTAFLEARPREDCVGPLLPTSREPFPSYQAEPATPVSKNETGWTLVPLRRGIVELNGLLKIMEQVTADTGEPIYICGGYARWCASPLYEPIPPNGIDVYCSGIKSYDSMAGIFDRTLCMDRRIKHASTYCRPSDKGHVVYYLPPLQLISPQYGSTEIPSILGRFDFSVCRIGIQDTRWAVADASFIADETRKQLNIKVVQSPWQTLSRCMKYVQRGYRLAPSETMKLFQAWDGLPAKRRKAVITLWTKLAAGKTLTAKERQLLEYESGGEC